MTGLYRVLYRVPDMKPVVKPDIKPDMRPDIKSRWGGPKWADVSSIICDTTELSLLDLTKLIFVRAKQKCELSQTCN